MQWRHILRIKMNWRIVSCDDRNRKTGRWGTHKPSWLFGAAYVTEKRMIHAEIWIAFWDWNEETRKQGDLTEKTKMNSPHDRKTWCQRIDSSGPRKQSDQNQSRLEVCLDQQDSPISGQQLQDEFFVPNQWLCSNLSHIRTELRIRRLQHECYPFRSRCTSTLTEMAGKIRSVFPCWISMNSRLQAILT